MVRGRPKEIVVMVGGPGSGKSTFVTKWMPKYERINNDTLKTLEKCKKACREALAAGKSAVIDNTNRAADARSHYVDIARDFGVPIRAFFFNTDKATCIHNNAQRKNNTHREHLSKSVPSVAIHTFFKNYTKPTISEGFESVETLEFEADDF